MKNKHLYLSLSLLLFTSFAPDMFASPPTEPAPSAPQARSPRHHRGRPYPAFLENLPEAEKERFKKLFRENPEAFWKEIHAFWKKQFEKNKAELIEIGKRYHATEDPAEKQKIAGELRSKLASLFEQHLKFAENQIRTQENRIRQMQKRLDHLKAQTERKKQNMQQGIDQAMEKVLKDSAPTGE